MPFRPKKKQPDFSHLTTTLAQVKETDNALYQTVGELIDRIRQFQLLINADIEEIRNSVTLINVTLTLTPDATNYLNVLKMISLRG